MADWQAELRYPMRRELRDHEEELLRRSLQSYGVDIDVAAPDPLAAQLPDGVAPVQPPLELVISFMVRSREITTMSGALRLARYLGATAVRAAGIPAGAEAAVTVRAAHALLPADVPGPRAREVVRIA